MIRIIFPFLIISFFLTPRIIFGIRLDDIILLVSSLVMLLNFRLLSDFKLSNPIFFYFIFIVFSLSLILKTTLLGDDKAILNSFVAFGKYLTYFLAMILAFVYARLYSGESERISKIIIACIAVNTCWFVFQIITGSYDTFYGGDVASAYGIKLFGEGAAFQVGMLTAYCMCFVVLFSKYQKVHVKFVFYIWGGGLLFVLYLTQSRISLLCAILMLLVIVIRDRKYHRGVILFSLFVLPLLTVFFMDAIVGFLNFTSRFSVYGVYSALEVRFNEIWSVVLFSIEQNIIFGKGLGSLLILRDTSEVHNFYLKLLFEGGVVYLTVFVFFVISVLVMLYNVCLTKKLKDLRLLLLVMLLGLCASGMVQDSFSSTKVVLPFMLLVGFVSGCGVRLNCSKYSR